MSTETIEVADIGPVERLSIKVAPGVTVLHGMNDSGKSLTIEAVQKLLGGKQKVTQRDDAESSGYVEGLGVTIRAVMVRDPSIVLSDGCTSSARS